MEPNEPIANISVFETSFLYLFMKAHLYLCFTAPENLTTPLMHRFRTVACHAVDFFGASSYYNINRCKMESFFANLCRKTEFVHLLQFDDRKIVHIYKPQKFFLESATFRGARLCI